jgi:hypothetical protein
MKIEIVTHCWRYSTLLTYQLSSLVLYPPRHATVLATVFFTESDRATCEVLRHFSQSDKPANVTIRGWDLPREQLLRRAIGRNMAALATAADWVWFADCDYCFGENALDTLGDLLSQSGEDLVFPRFVWSNRSEEAGDETIDRARGGVCIVGIDPRNFVAMPLNRAIGGVQIVRGEIARAQGYRTSNRRQQKPALRWMRTFEDVQFRRCLGTEGTPIDLPNVFRILHSRHGRTHLDARL